MLFKKITIFLSLFATLQISSSAFSALADAHPSPESEFINPEGYKELNYDGIIAALNRCETPFGPWALREMLTHALTTLDALIVRQNALKTLINDAQAFGEYKEIIQKINRPQLLTYWQPANPLHQNAQTLYYDFFGIFPKISNYLNSNKIALNLSGNVNSALTVLGYLGKNCLNSLAKEGMFSSYHKTDAHPFAAIKNGFYYPIHAHNPFQSYFKETRLSDFSLFFDSHKLSGGDWATYFQTFITNENLIAAAPYLAALGALGTLVVYDYFTAKDINTHLSTIKNTYKTTRDLSAEIHEIAQWYNGCAQLYDFSCTYPAFAQLPPFTVIKKYVHDQDVSPELKKLFTLLESLKDSSAISISTGSALLVHKLLRETKDELIPLMKAVGQYDALLSITKLYHECQGTHAPCCLPDFTHGAPTLEFTDFWHPGLAGARRVTNTINLGNTAARNIIITGPNGGGKSTAMAAISWGIILAQGWGIVPAQKAALSIFTGLRTFLSPQADLQEGMSTFMAEKKRLDSIIKTVDTLKNSDIFFFIIDEPCRGTIERVAEQFVIQLCNKLAESDKCISVLATHLEKPTFLAQGNAQYSNYQMELIDNAHGFIRTFKMLPGAAEWWFNDELKRTRFLLEL